MADEHVSAGATEAPPAGEAVHLPGPSYLPVATAAAIALAVVSLVISWILVGIGVLLTVILIWRWVQDTRRDVSELPLEHH
jgi:hypothetical protein